MEMGQQTSLFLLILVGAAEKDEEKKNDGISVAKKQHPQGDHSFNYW